MLVSNNKFTSVNSISNLFPTIYYDKSILSQPILDIWHSYKMYVFPKESNEEVYFYYVVRPEDNIYTISYKFYNTVELWWLILLANDAIDPLNFLDNIKNNEEKVVEDRENRVIRILKDKFVAKLKRDMAYIKTINEELNRKNGDNNE